MSTDEVRGHTGIVTSKPVPERCLRVRSRLHEVRRVVLGAWKKTPRAVSMVEREWGSLRSARESIEEASSSYSQGPDRGDS